MKGEKVIVRAFGDEPLLRVVWEVLPGVVLITTAEQFEMLKQKQRDTKPLGFPAEDVFYYDEAQWAAFTKHPQSWNWKRLRLYTHEPVSHKSV